MAYIPPHKRHSSTSQKPSPPPPPPPPSSPPLHPHSSSYDSDRNSRWLLAGSDGRPVPSSHITLHPFSCNSIHRKHINTPMIILPNPTLALPPSVADDPPWVFLAKQILPDIIAASENARREACSHAEHIKIAFTIKVGKIFFNWDSPQAMYYFKKAVDGDRNVWVRKNFHTSVPKQYVEHLERLFSDIGFTFMSEKEHCEIKILDNQRPNTILTCKCKVQSDRTLKLYKVEPSQIRYLVADTSCLSKDLDLRLMLNTAKRLKSLDAEEKDGILKLISSAQLDPNVKGGLRWPLGKLSLAGRFECIGVWQMKYKEFGSSLGRMKLRNADRFDYRDSYGEAENDVMLKMTKASDILSDDSMNSDALLETIQDALKLFWNHFLIIT